MNRKFLHSKRFPELLQHAAPVLVRIGMLPLLNSVEMILAGIFCSQLKQRQFVSLNRNSVLYFRHLYVWHKRHDGFSGEVSELAFNLGNEFAQHRFLFFLYIHAEPEIEALHNCPSTKAQERPVCIRTVEYQGENIRLQISHLSNDTAGIMGLKRSYAVFPYLRLFEIKRIRRSFHPSFILLYDGTYTPLQEGHYLFDPAVVLLR